MGVRSSQPRSPNLNKTDGHLVEYFRNAFSAGGGANATGQQLNGLIATGGTRTTYTDSGTKYAVHRFTSSGAFTVTAPGDRGDTVEYLVIAGGGGGHPGGAGGSGGGGAASADNDGTSGTGGTAYTGGGGGARTGGGGPGVGGAGGSGIVFVRYEIAPTQS